jgi:hypothetical protein
LDDRVVRLEEARGRRSVLKDPPASLELLESEEELPRYGVDALRRLAKSSGLEPPLKGGKDALVRLLTAAYAAKQAASDDGGGVVYEAALR